MTEGYSPGCFTIESYMAGTDTDNGHFSLRAMRKRILVGLWIRPLQSSEKVLNVGNQIRRPVWDRRRRELRLGKTVIKEFVWPAPNQERILHAFQQAGWPNQIRDPLPRKRGICPKRRLHDAIKCLNRNRMHRDIKFHGDGTGQGVLMRIRSRKKKK